MNAHDGPPMTLANAAAAKVRLIAWCLGCQHRPVETVAPHGAALPVLDWAARLVCGQCGGRHVDFVVTGTRR